jgi:hypothetical protein
MNVTLRIPDDIAARLTAAGADLERDALEGFALEAFRAGRLTRYELRLILGIDTRHELDGFLKARGVYEPVTLDDIQRDLEDLRAFRA